VDIDLVEDRLVRDFCKALGKKAKKHESPKRIAYRLVEQITNDRRGSRSINQYLADHADLMQAVVMRTHSECNADA
jgi:hypothetical protein